MQCLKLKIKTKTVPESLLQGHSIMIRGKPLQIFLSLKINNKQKKHFFRRRFFPKKVKKQHQT